MSERYAPGLLILVGDAARGTLRPILEESDTAGANVLSPSVEVISLDSNGGSVLRSDHSEDVWMLPGSLVSEVRSGVWTENRRVLEEHRDLIKRNLAASIRRLVDVRAGLADVQHLRTQIMVLTSMSEPIGSVGAIFILECLREIRRESLAEFPLDVHLTCLSHDLDRPETSHEEKQTLDLLADRAMAFLQELEQALDESSQDHPLTASVWLLDSRGASNRFVRSREEVANSIVQAFLALPQAQNIEQPLATLAMPRYVGGRRARYSAFGAARLIYPGQAYLSKTVSAATLERLNEAPFLQERMFDASSIYGHAGEFLTSQSVDRLYEVFEEDVDGRPVFDLPPLSEAALNEDDADRFLVQLDEWSKTLENTTLHQLPSKLEAKRRTHMATVLEVLRSRLVARIDSTDQGGLVWCESWLAGLTGDSSKWMERSEQQRREVVQLIDRPIQKFFDPLFAQAASEDILDPEALEAADITISAGFRQPLLVLEQRVRESDVRMADLSSRITKLEAGEIEVEPPDTPESLVERLEEQLKDVTEERNKTASLRSMMVRVVDQLNKSTESQTDRDLLRDQILAQHREGKKPREEKLNGLWSKMLDLRGLLRDLRQVLKRWMITRSGGTLVGLAILGLLWLQFSWVRSISWKIWTAAGIAAVVMLGFDFLARYWSPRQQILVEIDEVKRGLRSARASLLAHRKKEFEIKEEHLRFGQLVVFRSEFRDECEKYRRLIIQLRDRFLSFRDDMDRRAAGIDSNDPVPNEDPFKVQIPPAKALTQFVEEKRDEVARGIQSFWDTSKPSQFVEVMAGGLGVLHGSDVRKALNQALDRHFEEIRERVQSFFVNDFVFDLDEAFRRGLQTEAEREGVARRLWAAAAPQAFFSSEGFALSPEEFAYLGLTPADGGQGSAVEEALARLGNRLSQIIPNQTTEAQLVRFAVGYPGFAFAPAAKLGEASRDVVLHPDELSQLPRLAPSLESGVSEDVLRLAVLALGTGLITVAHDQVVSFGQQTFANFRDFLMNMASTTGDQLRTAIEGRLQKLEQTHGTEGKSVMEERLENALAQSLNLMDQEGIVRNHITTLRDERAIDTARRGGRNG